MRVIAVEGSLPNMAQGGLPSFFALRRIGFGEDDAGLE